MPRLPEKKTKKLAEWKAYATELGQLKARAHFKTLKTGKDQSFREHIGKFIDGMSDKIDPLELGASLCITPLIRKLLEGLDFFVSAAVEFHQQWNPITSWLYSLGIVPKGENLLQLPENEIFRWGFSFAVSYLIVHNFEAIINLGVGIGGFIKTFVATGI